MGLVKVIIFAILLWIGFRIYRYIKARKPLSPQQPKQISGDLVKCATCGIHLPRQEAVNRNNKYFCPPDSEDCGQSN